MSLEGLYAGLLRNVWRYTARQGETLQEQAERLSAVALQAKTVKRLERLVRRETNFAPRVEVNRNLRAAKEKHSELTGR